MKTLLKCTAVVSAMLIPAACLLALASADRTPSTQLIRLAVIDGDEIVLTEHDGIVTLYHGAQIVLQGTGGISIYNGGPGARVGTEIIRPTEWVPTPLRVPPMSRDDKGPGGGPIKDHQPSKRLMSTAGVTTADGDNPVPVQGGGHTP